MGVLEKNIKLLEEHEKIMFKAIFLLDADKFQVILNKYTEIQNSIASNMNKNKNSMGSPAANAKFMRDSIELINISMENLINELKELLKENGFGGIE